MAKVKAAPRNAPRNAGPIAITPDNIPQGYRKRTNEVVGFWNPKHGSPIHFIPKSARAFDNKTDTQKHSILIQGLSVGVNTVMTADGEVTECKSGDVIGVWYKPGMKTIEDLRNVKVFMYPTGEKDTGKPQPMQLFDVLAEKDGDTLYIDEDYRKESAHTTLPFEIKPTATSGDDTEAPF